MGQGDSSLRAAWPRWLASLALIAAAAVAVSALAAPYVFVLWGLLAAALVLLWLPRAARQVAGPVVGHVVAAPGPVDAAMRTRLASTEAELTSLRGVQHELLLAKQAAEAGMLSKSEFLASMSHEIRTPLNGILPLLDIVLGTDLAPEQREYLLTANASAKELLRIVDDILDYSKAEAGKLGLESVAVELRDLVDGVRRLLEKPAEAKGLAMRAVVDADVRSVIRGDPVRLRQILTNLVSNAIKFTQRGGVSVRVSRRRDTATQHEVLFAVRDTGIGLAPEAAARLFQPFTQADASVTRRYGGTGLGLTICKKLVDLMGGQIGVRSELGRGSVFWFTVPFEKVPGDIGMAQAGLAGLHALLVADAQRAQALAPALAALELDVSTVADSVTALARLRQAVPLGDGFRFGLLVVDGHSAAGDVGSLLDTLVHERQFDALPMLAIGVRNALDSRIVSVPGRGDDATVRQGVRRAFGLSAPASPPPELSEAVLPRVVMDATQLSGQVLLVEDHPVNQKVAQKLLERLGLAVDLAENGEAALDQLHRRSYAAVLMDCQMPVLDGYSATRRLRELESTQHKPRVPVIAMTAHAMAGDRERCLQAGMDDYLSKPLDRAQLAETLARWLQSRGPAGAGSGPAGPRPVAPDSSSGGSGMAPAPPPGTLHAQTLADLEDIMGDEVGALVDTYLRDGDVRMQNLRAAAARGDATEVGKLAHSLKSSSANLGALPLSARAREVEEAARSGTLADPVAGVNDLDRLYRDAAAALKMRYRK
ncbi:MAG TPA: ATP-binding protein [Rhodanobacteraceae bacterium]